MDSLFTNNILNCLKFSVQRTNLKNLSRAGAGRGRYVVSKMCMDSVGRGAYVISRLMREDAGRGCLVVRSLSKGGCRKKRSCPKRERGRRKRRPRRQRRGAGREFGSPQAEFVEGPGRRLGPSAGKCGIVEGKGG